MHHPSPFDPDDFDDLDEEELGTPVYEGTGLTVRALTHQELARFLDTHAQQPARPLGAGWEQPPPPMPPTAGLSDPSGLVAHGWPAAGLADPTRTPRGYGTPGRSAMATYRRERARERAAWARTLPWRAALVFAVAAGATIVAAAAGLRGAARLLAGLAAAAVVGWRLRFRPSRDTRAWRDGAHGERGTAHLLRRLDRRGHTVFHDVAIPGTQANTGRWRISDQD